MNHLPTQLKLGVARAHPQGKGTAEFGPLPPIMKRQAGQMDFFHHHWLTRTFYEISSLEWVSSWASTWFRHSCCRLWGDGHLPPTWYWEDEESESE